VRLSERAGNKRYGSTVVEKEGSKQGGDGVRKKVNRKQLSLEREKSGGKTRKKKGKCAESRVCRGGGGKVSRGAEAS